MSFMLPVSVVLSELFITGIVKAHELKLWSLQPKLLP